MQSQPAELRISQSVATLQGADDSLASINTGKLENGALVFVQATGTLYSLIKDSVAAENSPDIIAPDQGTTGRWFSLGNGAGASVGVQVGHAAIGAGVSVDAPFTLPGIVDTTQIVNYNLTDSGLPTGVGTGPVRITGTNTATMRFINTTGATVAAATVSFRMSIT